MSHKYYTKQQRISRIETLIENISDENVKDALKEMWDFLRFN